MENKEDNKRINNLERLFIEIESLIEIEKQEKEFNLEDIKDLSVILRKLGRNISNDGIRGLCVGKEYLLKVSELFYDRFVEINDYINQTLLEKLKKIETKNLKEDVLRVTSIENLIDFMDYLAGSICSKEKTEANYELKLKKRKEMEDYINKKD